MIANDMIEMALASALEELETVKKGGEEHKEMLNELMEKMDVLEKRFNEQKPAPVQRLNTAPIETAIVKGITRLQQTVEAQPKTVVHERRILLFPEYNAQEYYILVFGRLFFWLIVILLSAYLYSLGKEAIQSWYALHSQEKELNEYKRYFQYLESKEKKNVKNNKIR